MRTTIQAIYAYSLVRRLEYAESLFEQVRAIEAIAALLNELGEDSGQKILEAAAKYETEALYLDTVLEELRNEVSEGNLKELDQENSERLLKLRLALERFKAKAVSDLSKRLGRELVIVWGGGGE